MRIQLWCFVACMMRIPSVFSLQIPSERGEFGSAFFEFWHWDHGILNWQRKCSEYNKNKASEVQTRITGGTLADDNMFPYQVGMLLLRAPRVYQCGGVLITQRHVLTAAHCVYRVTFGKVYLGSTDFANDKTAAAVYNVTQKHFHIHEKYIYTGGHDDIALINLMQPVELSAIVQIIPLARSFMTQSLLEGEIVTASGWGLTSDGYTLTQPNLQLYYVDAPVMAQQECACYYLPGLVSRRTHICADGSNGRGTCDGDSGGPLTYRYRNVSYLVGLTVFGSAAGCEISYPSVYTRITAYLDWIAKRTDVEIE